MYKRQVGRLPLFAIATALTFLFVNGLSAEVKLKLGIDGLYSMQDKSELGTILASDHMIDENWIGSKTSGGIEGGKTSSVNRIDMKLKSGDEKGKKNPLTHSINLGLEGDITEQLSWVVNYSTVKRDSQYSGRSFVTGNDGSWLVSKMPKSTIKPSESNRDIDVGIKIALPANEILPNKLFLTPRLGLRSQDFSYKTSEIAPMSSYTLPGALTMTGFGFTSGDASYTGKGNYLALDVQYYLTDALSILVSYTQLHGY